MKSAAIVKHSYTYLKIYSLLFLPSSCLLTTNTDWIIYFHTKTLTTLYHLDYQPINFKTQHRQTLLLLYSQKKSEKKEEGTNQQHFFSIAIVILIIIYVLLPEK